MKKASQHSDKYGMAQETGHFKPTTTKPKAKKAAPAEAPMESPEMPEVFEAPEMSPMPEDEAAPEPSGLGE